MNTISIKNGSICLNFNGKYFKFIDVPGDGDYFYHCVLKHINILHTFNGVKELRIFIRDMVNNFIHNNIMLQRIFTCKGKYYVLWCSRITRMGMWVTSFDTLIFAYVMKIYVIIIVNYLNGFSANCVQYRGK